MKKKRKEKKMLLLAAVVVGTRYNMFIYAHDIFDRSNERDLFATTSHYTAQCKLINKMYIIHTRGLS